MQVGVLSLFIYMKWRNHADTTLIKEELLNTGKGQEITDPTAGFIT